MSIQVINKYMKQTIEYRIKQVYGKDTMYIVDELFQKNVEKLTGRKTMTDSDKRTLEALGIVFKQVI